MTSFRRELEDIRRQPEREAEQRRLRLEAELEAKQRERQQKELEAKRMQKEEFQKYVLPCKPMVDGLLRDLADVTWGAGNYGYRFTEGEDYPPPVQKYDKPGEVLAEWRVGKTLMWSVKESNPISRWLNKQFLPYTPPTEYSVSELFAQPFPNNWHGIYCFLIAFKPRGDGTFYFNVPARDPGDLRLGEVYGGVYKFRGKPGSYRTTGTDRLELEDLLKDEFIRGPYYVFVQSRQDMWGLGDHGG